MRSPWRLWLGLTLLVLALGAVVLHPAVRWRLIGWARGEDFYQGRPTSWWASEVEMTYDLQSDKTGGKPTERHWYATRPLGWREQVDDFLGNRPPFYTSYTLEYDPPLLDGNPGAFPVLMALLAAGSPKCRCVACRGLSHLGNGAKSSIPSLLLLIAEDESQQVREEAISASHKIEGQ
jgi:hypothetical protein